MSFYVSILLTYFFIDTIAALGLNMQVGLTGILNFGYILYPAIGAYAVAVFTLGDPQRWTGIQTYFAGWSLPFPLPILLAVVVGVALSALAGLLVLRRLREAYQGMVLLACMMVVYGVVYSSNGIFNGTTGLGSIPQPLRSALDLSAVGYQWAFGAFCGVLALILFFLVQRIFRSPFGRLLAASRESEDASLALGRNVFRMRMTSMMVGGGLGALSGALLVSSIGAWAPNSWTVHEAIVIFAALIVGGIGNNYGLIVGVAVFQTLITQGATFLPQIGPPGLIGYMQEIVVGLALMLVLWFAPQGLVPERRMRYAPLGEAPRRDDVEADMPPPPVLKGMA